MAISKEEKEQNEDLDKFKAGLNVPRQGELSPAEAREVIEQYSTDTGLSYTHSMAMIACFLQNGATARNTDGNLSYSYEGKPYKLAVLRNSLKKCGRKNQMRKLARVMANDIYIIVKKLDIEGNLYKKVTRMVSSSPDEFKNLSLTSNSSADSSVINVNLEKISELKYWLSDFQETNPDAPIEAKMLITRSFSFQPIRNRKTIPPKQKKTGK